jgi:hypothetical protein
LGRPTCTAAPLPLLWRAERDAVQPGCSPLSAEREWARPALAPSAPLDPPLLAELRAGLRRRLPQLDSNFRTNVGRLLPPHPPSACPSGAALSPRPLWSIPSLSLDLSSSAQRRCPSPLFSLRLARDEAHSTGAQHGGAPFAAACQPGCWTPRAQGDPPPGRDHAASLLSPPRDGAVVGGSGRRRCGLEMLRHPTLPPPPRSGSLMGRPSSPPLSALRAPLLPSSTLPLFLPFHSPSGVLSAAARQRMRAEARVGEPSHPLLFHP